MVAALALFEIANVFFIMPMPGSQEMQSLELAYFLHRWRWVFRVIFGVTALWALWQGRWKYRWIPILVCVPWIVVTYLANFKMAADKMFYQPGHLYMVTAEHNTVDTGRLIVGIAHNGHGRAYPVQYIGYHHQVRDSIGDAPVMVTYCTVCRTARVFEPVVNGTSETFRLVGMDHYNAMFEDRTTRSWWQQATGEAVAGRLKGNVLPEIPHMQMSLGKWIELYPGTMIMQPDTSFQIRYDSMQTYEGGRLKGRLTRRDTASWQPKSWVVGVKVNNATAVYDWNALLEERVIHDTVHGQSIFVAISDDNKSFMVFHRTHPGQMFVIRNDTLYNDDLSYNFAGKALIPGVDDLRQCKAYQEYWHSWQTFSMQ